jgi:hypothetical protein
MMAHFAQLDDDNKVINVIVVSNEDILDENGNESETLGIAFCQKFINSNWVQTSYNGNFRGKYAGIGDTWDGTNFVSPPVEPKVTEIETEVTEPEPEATND